MKKLFILSLFFSVMLAGQKHIFTVMTTKGKVEVKKADNSWQSLSLGMKLFEGEKIKLERNNYLGLFHVSGRTKELKDEGTYGVSELGKAFKSNESSVSSKYAGYLLDQLRKADESKSEMNTLGAVVREGKQRIELNFPVSTSLLEPTVLFSWAPISKNDTYVFQLINAAGNTVYMQEVKDTALLCDLQSIQIEKEKPYSWMIFSSANPDASSDTAIITLLLQNKNLSLRNEKVQLNEELAEDNALNHFILASFYQQNKLIKDAVDQYEACILRSPEIDDYFFAYLKCLTENGMEGKAERLMRQRNLRSIN